MCAVYDIFIFNNVDLQSKQKSHKLKEENKYYFKFRLNNIHIHLGLVIRLLIIFLYLSLLLLCRWAIMGFKGPIFQEIDNPAAFHPYFFNRVSKLIYINAGKEKLKLLDFYQLYFYDLFILTLL